ncbi:MAG: nucleoside-diphosphate kinase [Phycisphaerales bacterium]|nr:MAG: nucleoside-diphosphate kinase [Phycisphaerales bacterium]
MQQEKVEQTLVLIKPDALKNSVTGFLLSQLSEYHTGSRFAGAKIVQVSRMLAEQHYAAHQGKPFYEALLDYIMGRAHYPDDAWKRRVIAIVYLGPGALKKVRSVAGPTDPHVARDEQPGCIRALGTVVPIKNAAGEVISERLDNLIHASATHDEAEREIKLWFTPCDIPPLMRTYPTDVCEEHYYLKDGELSDTYEPGSVCLFAPGDVVWSSDLELLRSCTRNAQAASSCDVVIAKYLINRNPLDD